MIINMKKKIKVMLVTISLILIIVNLYPTAIKASSITIYVDGSGGKDYTKIQDAINNSSEGDTIYVYPGIYFENIVISHSINLIGEDKNTTIIDGSGIGNVISLNASNVNISGFTIQNSGGSNTHGLVIVDKNNNNIFGNIFTNNFIGINIHETASDNLIYHNNFFMNIFINAKDSSNKNQNHWDYDSEGNFWDDYAGADPDGDSIGNEPYIIFGPYNCQDRYPLMYPWQINTKTIYVDDSGGADYVKIQDALNISLAGDTVYVNSGIYYENLFIDRAINLIGEDKNTTIIDGGNNGDVVEVYAFNFKISGFKIQNSGTYLDRGLIIWDTSFNEITNNIFTNNYMGIALKENSDQNIIHQNIFIDNTFNAYDYTQCQNNWYDDYPSGGNYWDDYIGVDYYQGPNQNISGSDDIGDTPYTIQGSYQCEDQYPFLELNISSNNPPYTPSNPDPQDGATSIGIYQVLSWIGGDPDNGDIVIYDVYYGTSTNPPVVSTGQTSNNYEPGTMNTNTKYYWKIVAKDNHGASTIGPIWDFTTISDQVNNPPNQPNNPNPVNHATNIAITTDLSWSCTDPDDDPLTYDVYFGTTNPPLKKSSNQTSTNYNPATLEYNTKYYWKIIAWDNKNAKTIGSIWDFNTKVNNPPYPPRNPNPNNHETSVDINADLSWLGDDPDSGDTVTYDVYFGTTTNPPKVSSNQTTTTSEPGTMNYNTKYYWKIIAWDNNGAKTISSIWEFTTGSEPNYPPNLPNIPNPTNNAVGVNINIIISWLCNDPDNDPLTYDIYFGPNSNPPLIKSNHNSTSYTPNDVSNNTKYYWKIVVKDNHGAATTGPIWSFTTIYVNYVPTTPYNPTPQNGKTSININQDLYWDSGDPNTNDTLTYDIYFDTTSPPVKKISNQSATTYNPGTMNYNTKYYWKIIAWDNHGESSTGPIWSFTTGAQTSGGGGSSGGGGGGDIIPPNKTPVADASASEKQGFVNTAIKFDGSYSSDEDGEITNYTWDFGDNNFGYGILTTHKYEKTVTYTVKLTVTDNNDVSDTDILKVTISQPNNIPTIPQIDGPKTGKQNIEYSFTVISTDPDNDNIQYVFNWNDDQTDETDFVASGIAQIQKHKWTKPGIYKIKIYAIDSNYAVSASAKTNILIDVIYCKNLGHLIDEDSDEIYDLFYSNQTSIKTNTEKQQDGTYLINSDMDNDWEYTYNIQTDTLNYYSSETTPDEKAVDNTIFYYIGVIIIIFIILSLVAVSLWKKGKKEIKTEKEEEKK